MDGPSIYTLSVAENGCTIYVYIICGWEWMYHLCIRYLWLGMDVHLCIRDLWPGIDGHRKWAAKHNFLIITRFLTLKRSTIEYNIYLTLYILGLLWGAQDKWGGADSPPPLVSQFFFVRALQLVT